MASSSSSSSLLVLFNVCLLFNLMNFVLLKSDSLNENPLIKLSVSPNSGYSAENIEVRCEISLPTIISSLSSSKFDNVYLSVKTDNVKPSGILLMFHDSSDRCQVNREHVDVDVCNASLILVHIKHIILNETLQKIDYSCSKGSTYAYASYRLTRDQSARYYDPIYNSSSSLTYTYFVLLFTVFITKYQWL